MQGFRIGSILGFEIRIDASWFIIFLLILWSLSSSLFPAQFPQLSSLAHLVMGIVGTVLFFASLLTHELSHSLVARTKGIPVEGITLFIFGGMAQTRMEAKTPGDEFQIAGVGPLVSILLAILFGLFAYGGQQAGWSVAITGVAAYLALINMLLAIFNLFPGFPLDGGRLFRALIWKITGNLALATQIASLGGRLFGALIIALGFLQLLRGYLVGGIWFILIGWFLTTAAVASYQEQLLRLSLQGVQAQHIMTRHPETVASDLPLWELVDKFFLLRRYQAFPVIENDHPVGIVTLNQVKEIPRDQWIRHTVRDIMTPIEKGVMVRSHEKMIDVLDKMEASKTRRVLVADNGNLEGIITSSDLMHGLLRARSLQNFRRST